MNHRWLARGLVIALHAAVLLALWQYRPARLDAPGPQRVTTVRLIEPTRRTARTPAARPPAAPPPRLAAQPREPVLPTPQALPAADPSAAATAEPTAPAAAPAAAEAPRMTLRLTLPPGAAASSSVRSQALNDPRSNTRRWTFEERIANAAAVTGDWVEERSSDGRMRRRRGDTCVETEESRIAMMDRFNESVAPRATKMTGKPYKCPP